jgi:anti-anti-sigma factor
VNRPSRDDPLPAPTLRIAAHRDGTTGVIALYGDLDFDGRPRFDDAVSQLVDEGIHTLRVDAEHLAFIDSAGLTALVAAHVATEATSIEFQLAPVSENTRRLIALSGLANLLLPDDQAPSG